MFSNKYFNISDYIDGWNVNETVQMNGIGYIIVTYNFRAIIIKKKNSSRISAREINVPLDIYYNFEVFNYNIIYTFYSLKTWTLQKLIIFCGSM